MTLIEEYGLTCSCRKKFKAPLYDSINVTLNPNLLNLLFEGKFNVVKCPKCHLESYIDRPFLFHDMRKKLMMEVGAGQIDDFMRYLASKGYFHNFKKSSKI